MEQSSKRHVSIKLTPNKEKQVAAAIMLLVEHYKPLLAKWDALLPEQRDEVLVHSQQLARLIELTRGMHGA